MQTMKFRHCEEPQATKQPSPALGRDGHVAGLLRLAMTAAGAGALLPSLALAHPGHGAPLFHSHAGEIALALVAAVVGIRAYRRRK